MLGDATPTLNVIPAGHRYKFECGAQGSWKTTELEIE
jgi:hypothetical protein